MATEQTWILGRYSCAKACAYQLGSIPTTYQKKRIWLFTQYINNQRQIQYYSCGYKSQWDKVKTEEKFLPACNELLNQVLCIISYDKYGI